jgi:Arc/MetJ family transcription regulator
MKTLVDIDPELLAAATETLGTVTKKDTINTALREVVARIREQRRLALLELQRMTAEGVFDFDILTQLDQDDHEIPD